MRNRDSHPDLLVARLHRLSAAVPEQRPDVETILKFYLDNARAEALSRFNIYELNSSQKKLNPGWES